MTYYIGCIYENGCRDVKILASSEDDAYEILVKARGTESIIIFPRLPREDESIDCLEEVY